METRDQGVAELVSQASEQLSQLVRQEMRLAATEVTDKARHGGLGAGLFGGATVLALYGGGITLIAIVAALALVWPGWLAALVVAVALFLTAGVLALLGRRHAKQAAPPIPEQAIGEVRQDVTEIGERARR